jgi:tRNA 2-thiouridine synthesizing protein D
LSLSYALVVTGDVYGNQATHMALEFAKALAQSEHKLNKVFFYQSGVSQASEFVVPANDELHVVQEWQTLAQQHQFALETCVAAALRRGVVSEDEAKQHQLAAHNVAHSFEQVGLGSLAEALLSYDRVVQF